MLSLTVRPGEAILIGDNIRVMFVRHASKGGVMLGIQAPRDIEVDREVVRASKMADRAGADCSEISGAIDAGGTVHSDSDPGL